MWAYVLFRLAIPVVAAVPRSLLAAAGSVIGIAMYAASRRARASVLRNLAVVVSDADPLVRRRLAVRTFIHGVWGYIELLLLARVRADELQATYRVDGWEHLDAALQAGKGVIMVTCHAGSPSAAGQLIALHGVPTTLVVEPLQPARLHDLVARLRGAFGVRIIAIGRESVREIISALRRNELVGIVCDRDVAGSGQELPFFGRKTHVTTAAATLARRTNAAILPAFAARTGLFAGRGRIEPPVEMPRTGDAASDIREGEVRILARIEVFIREHPEQWAVFSEVWPRAEAISGSDRIGAS